MTPADEIAAAASRLRSLTADATDGPWHHDDPNQQWGEDRDHRIIGGGKILATFSSDHNGPLNAMYAAAMHPGVGDGIARWLESTAVSLKASTHPDWQECVAPDALAVARAINGSQP